MKRIVVSLSIAFLAVGAVFANAEDAANLIGLRQDLTLTESVLNKGTGGSIRTDWDRMQTSPEDLPNIGPGRDYTLGVWQDTDSEYDWIVFSQASNNSVQDAFGGGFLTKLGDRFTFGFSMGFYTNEHENGFFTTNPAGTSGNVAEVSAESYDMRGVLAWQLTDNMNLGFSLNMFNQEADSEFEVIDDVSGGFASAIETENDAVLLTGGFKHFLGDNRSYNIHVGYGQDTAKGWELDTDTDPMGVPTFSDWYLLDLEADTFKLGAQYNRRLERDREWNVNLYYRNSSYDLQNTDLDWQDDMGTITIFEQAVSDDITDENLHASFNFVKAWEETEWYCGVGFGTWEIDSMILSRSTFTGSTFDETYVDSTDEANLWVGFRHHFTEKFALFGSAGYTHFNQDLDFTFTQRDDIGNLDFTDRETATWEEGDTEFHLGVSYVASNFTLDALYEPESSISSPFRGFGLGTPDLPGSGRNSVSSDRITFAATFNW